MSLQVHGLTKAFDGLMAIKEVSFVAGEGLVTSVIGPNGAGKTTLFNVITGYIRADAGKVIYQGEDLTHLPPHKIVRKGIGRSFQIVNIFPMLTVFENVQVALISRLGKSPNFISKAKNIGSAITEETNGFIRHHWRNQKAGMYIARTANEA